MSGAYGAVGDDVGPPPRGGGGGGGGGYDRGGGRYGNPQGGRSRGSLFSVPFFFPFCFSG